MAHLKGPSMSTFVTLLECVLHGRVAHHPTQWTVCTCCQPVARRNNRSIMSSTTNLVDKIWRHSKTVGEVWSISKSIAASPGRWAGDGTHPNSLRAKEGLHPWHPGQVTSLSQGHIEGNNPVVSSFPGSQFVSYTCPCTVPQGDHANATWKTPRIKWHLLSKEIKLFAHSAGSVSYFHAWNGLCQYLMIPSHGSSLVKLTWLRRPRRCSNKASGKQMIAQWMRWECGLVCWDILDGRERGFGQRRYWF